MKKIVKDYRKEKYVAIVCSAGIAATHYGGRHVTIELIHLVQTDERFVKVKNNNEMADLLVIDGRSISMISAKTFNQSV